MLMINERGTHSGRSKAGQDICFWKPGDPGMRRAWLDAGSRRSGMACERALLMARQDPPAGVSPDEAAAASLTCSARS